MFFFSLSNKLKQTKNDLGIGVNLSERQGAIDAIGQPSVVHGRMVSFTKRVLESVLEPTVTHLHLPCVMCHASRAVPRDVTM